jgi:cytochrome c-type biogenesis protein CcmF
MPWLAGTALLHSSVVVEKRDALKGWTIFLAIVTFSLSLLGAFLVRSGVLTSVHAFASDPDRGVFILVLLVLVIGGSLTLFAARGPALKSGGLFQPISREGALLLNNLLMTTAAAAVLLGTLYPLFLDAVGGGKVSVGPPFFNAVFIPLMLPMIAAMAIGPLLAWKRADISQAMGRMWIAFITTGAVVLLIWWLYADGPVLAALGMGFAVWLLGGTAVELAGRIRLFRVPVGESPRRLVRIPRATWGMTIGHAGLAVVVAGMVGAGNWKVESIQVMVPGQTVTVAGYDYTFKGAAQAQGPNYTATRGVFDISRDGAPVITVYPENRLYPVQQSPTTEAAIHTTFWADLYVVIGDPDEATGGYVTRIYHNPMIAWIWAGLGIMFASGLVSLSDRRHRIGAPQRRRGATGAAAAAEA